MQSNRSSVMNNLYKIGEDGKFVINRSRIPADVSPEIAAKIAETAQKIADAFALKNTPMLIQLISNGEDIAVFPVGTLRSAVLDSLISAWRTGSAFVHRADRIFCVLSRGHRESAFRNPSGRA